MTLRPILLHIRRFPPPGYHAITLFPLIIYRDSKLAPSELRHETIHLWQQAALLVVPFYLLYLLFWLAALLRFRNWHRAYRAIPFERSSYRLEGLNDLSPCTAAFDWLRCFRTNP